MPRLILNLTNEEGSLLGRLAMRSDSTSTPLPATPPDEWVDRRRTAAAVSSQLVSMPSTVRVSCAIPAALVRREEA